MITVKYFASLRSVAGKEEEQFSMGSETTIEKLSEEIKKKQIEIEKKNYTLLPFKENKWTVSQVLNSTATDQNGEKIDQEEKDVNAVKNLQISGSFDINT